jgi:hypothetical protein
VGICYLEVSFSIALLREKVQRILIANENSLGTDVIKGTRLVCHPSGKYRLRESRLFLFDCLSADSLLYPQVRLNPCPITEVRDDNKETVQALKERFPTARCSLMNNPDATFKVLTCDVGMV